MVWFSDEFPVLVVELAVSVQILVTDVSSLENIGGGIFFIESIRFFLCLDDAVCPVAIERTDRLAYRRAW